MKNNTLRRQRERQELRLRVLEAARELFADGGEEAVTLRKVAEKIEYSATTIYLYFPCKELLVRELCALDFEAFTRAFKLAERTTDPMDRLRKVALTYVDFGLQHPRHYRSMFLTPRQSGSPEPAAPDIAKDTAASGPHDFLYASVFKAMAAGCFRPEYRDVPMVSQVIWAGLHGVIALHLVRAGFSTVDWRSTQTTVEMMVEVLLNGLTR